MAVAAQLSAVVNVQGAQKAKADLESVGKSVGETHGLFSKLREGFEMGLGFQLADVPIKAFEFLKDQIGETIKAGMDQQQIMSQTAAVLKSTGDVSGMSASKIEELASSLSHVTTFSDDTVQSGENLLLTFTNIGQQTFPQATQAMLDISQAMGQDVKSSAIQLGKALNDPLTGMSALQRVGVTFDAGEKNLIKTMMAHNNIAGAQKVILGELNKEFGNSAQAAGKTAAGAWQIFTNRIEEAKEKIGTALLPILAQLGNNLSGALLPVLDKVSDFLSSNIGPAFQKVGDMMRPVEQIIRQLASRWSDFAADVASSGIAGSLENLGKAFGKLVSDAAPFVGPMLTNLNNMFISIAEIGLALLQPAIDMVAGALTDMKNNGVNPLKIVLQVLSDTFHTLNQKFDDAIPKIQTFVGWLQNGGTPAQVFKDALAGIAASFVIIRGINLAASIGNFIAQLPGLATGLWAASFGADALTIGLFGIEAPVLLVAAIIAVAVAGIILAIQHWGEITKWLSDRWKDVSKFFSGVWEDIKKPFQAIGGWFHDRFTDAKNGAQGAWSNTKNFFTDRWHDIQSAFGGVGKWFGDRFGEIKTYLAPIVNYWYQWGHTIWVIIAALFGIMGRWFGDRFHEAVQAIVKVFTPIVQWFKDRLNEIFKGWQIIGAWFRDRAVEIWNYITKTLAPIVQWFKDRLSEIFKGWQIIGAWFRDRAQEAWNGITTVFAPIGRWFSDRWNDIVGGVIAFKNRVVGVFNDIKNAIVGAIRDAINGMIDKLQGGINGVVSFVNMLANGLNTLANTLAGKGSGTIPMLQSVHLQHYASGTDSHPGGLAVLGEEGPEVAWLPPGTKVMPHGKSKGLLGALGIPGYAGGIGDIASNVLSWVASGAQSVVNHVIDTLHLSIPSLPSGMGNIAQGMFNKVKDWAVSFVDHILPKVSLPGVGGGGGASGNFAPASGNVASWIQAAIGATGVPGNWSGPLATIIQFESGGNPNAINLTDINAQMGHPSQGLMQTIPSTFAAYALPGYGGITSPVANIIAGIRYILARYGSVFNVPGIVNMAHGGNYVGYRQGGTVGADGVYMVGEDGPELAYLPKNTRIIPNHLLNQPSYTSGGGGQQIILQVDGNTFARLFMPYVVSQIRNNVGVKF